MPGPVAVRVQSRGTAVPPLSLVTVLINVSRGAIAVLVIVQVACWPRASAMEPAPGVPPTHAQADAEYPLGPDSDSA